jgi:hypothetical protein
MPEATAQQTPGTAGGGWQQTRWGMTGDEISKVMPGVTPLDKPPTFERSDGLMGVARLGIQDFLILGQHYTVSFLPDENDRLEKVLLHPKGDHFPSSVLRNLEQLLTAKYGKATLSHEQANGGRNDTWILDTATIELNYVKVGDSYAVSLIVTAHGF